MSPSTIPGPPPAPPRAADPGPAQQQEADHSSGSAPEGFASLLGQVAGRPAQSGPHDPPSAEGETKEEPKAKAREQATTDAPASAGGSLVAVAATGAHASGLASAALRAPVTDKAVVPTVGTLAAAAHATTSDPASPAHLEATASPGASGSGLDPAKPSEATTTPNGVRAAAVTGRATSATAPATVSSPAASSARPAATPDVLAPSRQAGSAEAAGGRRGRSSGARTAEPRGASGGAARKAQGRALGTQTTPARPAASEEPASGTSAGSAPEPKAQTQHVSARSVHPHGRAGREASTQPSQAAAESRAPEETLSTPSASSAAQRQAQTAGSTAKPRPLAHALDETINGLVRVASRGGAATARITLTPPELGSVEIRLRMRGTTVTAELTADSSRGVQALGQSVADLRRSLEAQGLVVQGLDIRQSGPDGGTSSRQEGSEANARANRAESVRADDEVEIEVAVGTTAPAGEQVDVLA